MERKNRTLPPKIKEKIRERDKICKICGEEHPEDEMIREVCLSCASIMQDRDFEC